MPKLAGSGGGGKESLKPEGADGSLHRTRGAHELATTVGIDVHQNLIAHPDVADVWHQVKAKVQAKWPSWTDEQHDKVVKTLMKTNLADAMQFSAGWLTQTMSATTSGTVERMPNTIGYTAVAAKDPLLTSAATKQDQFLVDLYGGDTVGPVLSTFLIDNSRSAAATREVVQQLFDIPHIDAAWDPNVDPRTNPTDPTGIDTIQELLSQPDPVAAYKALPPADQDALHIKLKQVLDQGKSVAGGVQLAHTILNSGEFGLVMSKSDIARVNEMIQVGQAATDAGRTNDLNDYTTFRRNIFLKAHPGIDAANVDEGVLNRMMGIDQYQAIGKGGTIVMDKEWAQAHPDKAAALKVYLEQTFPDTELKIGRNGVIGSFMDAYNQGIDAITSPIGAGIRQVSELIERVDVGPWANHTAAMQAQADAIKAKLKSGGYKKSEIAGAQKDLNNLEEDLNNNVGWDAFNQDIQDARSTDGAGLGFGNLFAQSLGINPGDSTYTAVAGVSGIVSLIAADPLNWVTAGAGAWLKARYIPKFLGEARDIEEIAAGIRDTSLAAKWSEPEILKYATNIHDREVAQLAKTGGYQFQDVGGFFTQHIYQALAKTPEELAATKRFSESVSSIWDLKQSLTTDNFVEAMAVKLGNRRLAQRLGQAEDINDMHAVLANAMTGGSSWRSAASEGLLVERTMLTNKLRDLKYSPEGMTWEQKLQDLYDQYDEVYAGRRGTRSAELEDLNREIDHAENMVEDYQSQHWDIRQRRAYLTDVAKSEQTDAPIQVLRGKTLKRLRQLTETHTATEDALVPAEDLVSNGLASPKMTPTERFRQMAKIYSHPFTNYGYGHEMVFEGPGAVHSLQELHKFAVEALGVPEDRVAELLAPLANGSLDGDFQRQFEWIHDTWMKLANESDLPAAAKQEIENMYRSREGIRAGGLTNETGQLWPTPTLYDQAKYGLDVPEELRAQGIASGFPSISAREMKGVYFKLPSLDQMFELRGFTRNLLKDMAEGRRAARFVSGTLSAAGKTWESATNVWRDSVLIPRMIGALPARIFLEQQARIAAYGEASLFFHPIDWFSQLGHFAEASDDELRLFASSPTHMLGGITDKLLNDGYNLPTGGIVTAKDPRFIEGVNQAMREWVDSPELVRWHIGNLGDTEATLRSMHSEENAWLSDKFFRRYDSLSMDHAEAVTRTQRELLDHIGTGPGADRIRSALENDGWVYWPEHHHNIRIGSENFTKMLEDMYKKGEWVPNTKMISADVFRYVPTPDRTSAFAQFRDFAYRSFYSKPDLYFSRSDLYRGIATREFKNLTAAGYEAKDAAEIAKLTAAHRTADMMFTIGAHSTGEHFLKNLMPFFPAWRELADTWLLRIPTHLGRLGEALHSGEEVANGLRVAGWGIGAVQLTHRMNLAYTALSQAGILKHDANGNLVVPLPSLFGILQNALGVDVPMVANADVGSLFGMFPLPEKLFSEDHTLSVAQRVFGAAPGLGAPATIAIKGLADAFGQPHWTTYLTDILSPYGLDPGLTTTNVENLLIATGQQRLASLLAGGSASYQNAMVMSTISDGLRMYTQNHPVPDLPKGIDPGNPKEMQHWHDTVLAPWLAAGIKYANAYKTRSYLGKAIIGSVSPVSIHWTDEGSQQMQQLWDTIRVFQDVTPGNEIVNSTIQTFLHQYPELEAYMTSKYIDKGTSVNTDEDPAHFKDAILSGRIVANDVYDMGQLMVYNNSLNLLHRKKDTLDRQIQNHPDPARHYLLDSETRLRRANISQEIQDYQDWSHTPESKLGDSHSATAGELYDEIQKYRLARTGVDAEEDVRHSLNHKQIAVLNAEDSIRILNLSLDPADGKTQHYYTALNNVHAKLAAAYQATDNPFWLAISHFYKTNADYYDKTNTLYDGLTGDTQHDAVVYNQIRNLNDQYGATTSHGMDLPSPEEYAFFNKPKQDQEALVAKWAALPGTYLSEFQRSQAYPDFTPKQLKGAHAVSNLAFRAGVAEDTYLKTHTSDADRAYADKKVAESLAAYAKEKGVSAWWNAQNQPEFVRIGAALKLGDRTDQWNTIADAATTANAAIIKAGYTPSGQGTLATSYYNSMIHGIHALNDPDINAIINEMSTALASKGQTLSFDETIKKLFFGVYYGL